MRKSITRRDFVNALGAGAASLALAGVAGCGSNRQPSEGGATSGQPARGSVRSFRTRPELHPPAIQVNRPARGVAPGYIFVVPDRGPGQYGPMILDDRGEPVWFRHSPDRLVRDFRAQSLGGRPVLTWWEGKVVGARGIGEYVILDDTYTEISRLQAGSGYEGDLHEFKITPRDTAFVTAYHRRPADLSPLGGPQGGTALEGVAQELDVETGEVLFEWRSLDHVGVEESYLDPPDDPGAEFDYFHINSIERDHDGSLLVSARNTWAVYKLDPASGEVVWRLGGKNSDFEMGSGTKTAYQHDARRRQDGSLTIFDNGAAPKVHEESRGMVLEVDESAMTATLTREYRHPNEKLLAGFLGNVQTLPNGNVFVGWGSEPFFSEFSPDGKLLFDARFPPEQNCYRSYRLQWNGHPPDRPTVATETSPESGVTTRVSWNGATEVASWEMLSGPSPDRLSPEKSVPRDGFETTIEAPEAGPYIAVRGRDARGRTLGTSKTVRT